MKNTKSNRKKGKRRKDAEPGKSKKRSWSGIFDNMNYSSGPGDNVYVYG